MHHEDLSREDVANRQPEVAVEDLHKHVNVDLSQNAGVELDYRDPAPELNDRLRKRSFMHLVRKVLMRVFLAVLVSLVFVGVVAYAKAMETMTSDTVTDYRDCKWQIGKYELTGRRSYTYPYHEVFGFRFIDKSRVTEQTVINTPRDTTTVVTINGKDNWFGDQQEEGPAGTMKLKPGKMYVVVAGKNFGAFDHDAFCTQQPKKEL